MIDLSEEKQQINHYEAELFNQHLSVEQRYFEESQMQEIQKPDVWSDIKFKDQKRYGLEMDSISDDEMDENLKENPEDFKENALFEVKPVEVEEILSEGKGVKHKKSSATYLKETDPLISIKLLMKKDIRLQTACIMIVKLMNMYIHT